MKFSITKREAEGVTIFDLAGRMSFPDPHIQPVFATVIKEGCKGFVINLAGVSYMDSYGLNDLVAVYKATKAAGAKLILLNPNPNVKRTIEITMKTIFAFADDEAGAIEAVR